MNRTAVSSTQLSSIGYDEVTATLEVEFHKGGIYQYFGVSAETYRQLMTAESVGTYFNEMIRSGDRVYRRVR